MRYAAGKLEVLRAHIKKMIHITSWFRGETLNLVIPGSSRTSAHMTGFAIDCHIEGHTPLELCKIAAELFKGEYDQIIHEYGTWMHISFDPRARGQQLTIFKGSKKYIKGLLTEAEYLSS